MTIMMNDQIKQKVKERIEIDF